VVAGRVAQWHGGRAQARGSGVGRGADDAMGDGAWLTTGQADTRA